MACCRAPTIPEQIAGSKQPYYDALEAADKQLVAGKSMGELEKMLAAMVSTQLLSTAKEASGEINKLTARFCTRVIGGLSPPSIA
jgi:hypothetical protein